MGNIIVFNVTEQGASHIKTGKPCQDYSLSCQLNNETVQVAIVCDGHGGDTYVRSNIGSQLAAEIALRNIQSFILTTSPKLFLGMKGAVTARPDNEIDLLFPVRKREKENLTERELSQQEQNRIFYSAVEDIREQDSVFSRLFASIYLQWKDAINQNAKDYPFDEYEKACLKGNELVKAYGTTLIAFVRTPLYWFAFQIGDGKLLCCNRNLDWVEPVPWDCNCFLNMTTSLCNSNPISEFRYAFSGMGDFPVAVIMGSDGLDDSWGTIERLQNFYSQTLGIFDKLGDLETIQQLKEFLPKLSEKASRDDMSMAGIIDMDAISLGVKLYNLKRELNDLDEEKSNRKNKLQEAQSEQERLDKEINHLSLEEEKYKQNYNNWWQRILVEKEKKVSMLKVLVEQLSNKKKERNDIYHKVEECKKSYNEWLVKAEKRKDILLNECLELEQVNAENERKDIYVWNNQKECFESNIAEEIKQNFKKRVERMTEYNEEVLKVLHHDIQESVLNDSLTGFENIGNIE